jgi:uncharacterized integral membrane protein
MRQLRWFVALVLLFGALAGLGFFVLSNKTEVPVELPFLAKFYWPVWLVLSAAFFAGACSASAGLLFQLARKSLAARRAAKRVLALESELEQLRGLPAAADDSQVAPAPPSPGA